MCGPVATAWICPNCAVCEGGKNAGDFIEAAELRTHPAGQLLTWFDLHPAGTDPLPTVNWRHVENGKITAIRVIFDPRPLTTPAPAGGDGPP